MSNLRIVYDNLVDRGTVTASSTAGALVASNLQTDTKSDVWRATGTSARLTLAWAVAEAIQAVALPFCNLSPTATMRVRATNETLTTNLLTNTEGTVATLGSNSGVTDAGPFVGFPFLRSIQVVRGTATAYAYRTFATAVGTTYTFSIFVMMDDGGAPVVGPSTATGADISLVVQSDALSGAKQTISLGAGLYRLTYTFTATTTGVNYGVAKYTTQSARGFRITGYQLELGSTVSSYYPSQATQGVRPTGYIDTWQTYAYDSGAQLACPAPALRPRGWTAAQAASAYAYGGGAYARMWLPTPMQATGVAVDIVDTNNLQGYVEAARLIVGPYWSPLYNAKDAPVSVVDTTELYRTDAGDQSADAGYIYRRVPVSLAGMTPADRTAFMNIIRNSRAYPVLISVRSDATDLELERDNLIYGRRSKDSDLALQYAAAYATTVEVEEI